MRKTTLTSIVSLLVVGISVAIYAQSNGSETEHDAQIAKWEHLAEQGDTAAMHRLIEFYDENALVYVEVEEVIEVVPVDDTSDESVDTAAVVDDVPLVTPEQAEHYAKRLDYWLNKGITMNDPVALATKGMRLYYEDEANAISYLSRAADAGSAKAALFCGSACLNQHKGDEAFKYLSLAYDLGAPSAGWHLAMCYSAGIGTAPDREKAIEVMRHAAIMNYPEAVSEMRRIEPDNKIWHHKADSLKIDFPDFEIIPTE